MTYAVVEMDKQFHTNRATTFATSAEADAYCDDLKLAYQFTDGEESEIFVCPIEEPMDRGALGALIHARTGKD